MIFCAVCIAHIARSVQLLLCVALAAEMTLHMLIHIGCKICYIILIGKEGFVIQWGESTLQVQGKRSTSKSEIYMLKYERKQGNIFK